MIYELMGRAHAALARERGQGTVEYVGLVLLMAVLIAGVVKASGSFSDTGIAEAVVKKLKAAIDGVGGATSASAPRTNCGWVGRWVCEPVVRSPMRCVVPTDTMSRQRRDHPPGGVVVLTADTAVNSGLTPHEPARPPTADQTALPAAVRPTHRDGSRQPAALPSRVRPTRHAARRSRPRAPAAVRPTRAAATRRRPPHHPPYALEGVPDWRRGRARPASTAARTRGASPAPRRRVRLRRRRAHRAARAARPAPPRGLRVLRRRRALPVRRALAHGARGVLAADRRGAARPPDQAARRRLQLGDRGGAARAARAADADDARRRRAGRGPARRGAGRRRHAQRAHRRDGDAGHGGQRRLRGGDRRGRPVRRRHQHRLPGPDRDHRGRLPVRPARRRHRARVLRAR